MLLTMLLALVGALAGCGTSGSGGADGSAQSPGSTTTATTTVAPTSVVGPSGAPVPSSSIVRAGGIAGFQDTVVVAADGSVTTQTRAAAPRHCRLTTVALDALGAAAAEVPWTQLGTAGSTTPTIADELVVTVQSPTGAPVRATDPDLRELSGLASDLLADVLGARPAYRLCPSTD